MSAWSCEQRQQAIAEIRRLPEVLAVLVVELSAEELTTPYLAGEWTVAQNVHHLADSHMNSYIRCKLIATENNPTLKPYEQADWAELPDAKTAAIDISLALLTQLHARWAAFWEALPDDAWERTGFHPENGVITLDTQLQTYAAHGLGHLDQITRTLAARP